MRRPAPKALGALLAEALPESAPATLLARAQAAWPKAAGAVIAAEAAPVSEREGTLTIACSSAVWGQELELMAGDLIGPLNALLGVEKVRRLRFVTDASATTP